jgi:DNA-binding PadR family transcriptional regulator
MDLPRLSAKESLILELLDAESSLYGLQMVEASREQLKRGTVYVTLARMEEKGLIRSRTQEPPDGAGGLPRRIYEATPHGVRVFKAWSAMLRALRPEMAR